MHTNNFDFLRLMAAFAVVIGHSYWLSGMQECNWLCSTFTDFKVSLSQMALRCLFIISGFLIFKSLVGSTSLLDYFRKRALRIFPALYIVLLLTVIVAPFAYSGNLQQYISNASAWTYLPNNLLLVNLQWFIDGVFEGNPYNAAINGSLWSIPYEFCFYILLCPLFIFRKRPLVLKTILLVTYVYLVVVFVLFKEQTEKLPGPLMGKYLVDFGLFFFGSSLLAVFNFERSPYLKPILVSASLLFLISLYFSFFYTFQYFIFPFVILPLGLMSTKYVNNIRGSIGDLSYGIYIYSFPIQQMLMYHFKFNYLQLMVSSLILSFIFGYLSWHLLEKRALKFKNTGTYFVSSAPVMAAENTKG